MLKSKRSDVLNYLLWFRTKNLYIGTTWYLLGMAEDAHTKFYPGLKCVRSAVNRNVVASEFRYLCILRRKIVLASSSEELEECLCSLSSIEPCLPYDKIAHLKGYLMSTVYSALRHRLYSIKEYYPPVFPTSTLHSLLIGGKRLNDYQKLTMFNAGAEISKAFMTETMCLLVDFDDDRDFILSIASASGISDTWADLCHSWQCHFADESEIFIDAENMEAVDFGVFLQSQAYGLRDIRTRISLVSSTVDPLWKFVFQLARFNVDYRVVKRLSTRKSLVDFELISAVSQAYFKRGCRIFYIFSSDSDYNVLLSTFPDAQFNFVCKRSITSRRWAATMRYNGATTYWLDESCSGWNHSVLVTSYIMYNALKEKQEPYKCDDDWRSFLTRIGYTPEMTFAKVARTRLLEQ